MTIGGNAQFKTLIHKKERELVRDYVNCFKVQLKETEEFKDNLIPNPVYIQLRAKIEFGEKLLGRR